MNAKRTIHAAILALFAAGTIGAQSKANDAHAGGVATNEAAAREAKARKVLGVTGITEQAQGISQVIIGMFEQQKGALSDGQQSKLYGILASSFAQTKFDAFILDELMKGYNGAYCDTLLKTYADPFFADITKTEVESNTPDIFSKIAAFDYGTVDKERDAIIDEYVTNSSTLEFQELLTVSGIEAFVKTYNLFLPKENRITPETRNAIIDQTRKQIKSTEQRASIKKNFAVIYQKYDNAQLKRYFDFYKTAEARWLSDAFCAGFNTGFESCMNDAAKRIVSELHVAGDDI